MVEAADDFLLALKAAVENHVALELEVGNFDRDGLTADGDRSPLKIDAIPLRAITSVNLY